MELLASGVAPWAICGSKKRPSPPGKTLRCKALTSASILRMRASDTSSCAKTGAGVVANTLAATPATKIRVMGEDMT